MKTAFIGAGNMSEAIVSGLLADKVVPASEVIVTDVRDNQLDYFRKTYGVEACRCNEYAIAHSDTVVLAVKPQSLDEAMQDISKETCSGKLFISIMAGVSCARLASLLGDEARIVRVMPNTPALIGCGAAAYAAGPGATAADLVLTKKILESVGIAVKVPESQLDAVTAISGSGPAYVFYLIESMLTAAEGMGLDSETARELVLATVEGSARLMKDTGDSAEVLRAKVTSKGGTTYAATTTFDHEGVKVGLVKGMIAARDRSVELSG